MTASGAAERRRGPLALWVLVIGTIILAAADRAFPPDLSRYRDRSVAVEDRAGAPLRVFAAGDGIWRMAVRPDEVDPGYLGMLLAVEDRRFRDHGGVDPLALARALWQRITTGRVVSGGSTLTMQTARLLMPHRHTLLGKFIDIVRAAQLEERYGKDEILAMYLTLAPFGGNLEGVRAASLAYFDRLPSSLRPEQAALLVALPRLPSRLRPDRFPAAATMARDQVLRRSVTEGLLGAARGEEAVAMPVPTARQPFPFMAPHLAAHLIAGAPPADGVIRTTLDRALQQAVADLAGRTFAESADHADMAAIVVDNRDRSVLAWQGGSRFQGPAGQIDLATASRSPGSALKPFIYGLAFDDPIVVPETRIEDRPMRFEDYAPQNFDRSFHGSVTVREALQQSYNVPAIELLERIGPSRLAATLRQAGAVLRFPDHETAGGLPLALGGVGISLADLTMLYAGIAEAGEVRALRLRSDEPPGPIHRIFGAAAAWMVGDVLRGSPMPDGLADPVIGRSHRPVAFKTGTSYGFRDAWALGFSPTYSVGVWVGRPDGTPRADAFGRNTAAPLLFSIFDLLPPESVALPPTPPDDGVAGSRRRPAPGLAAFRRAVHGERDRSTAPPRILYPPNGAVIELPRRAGSLEALALEAEGGRPPYRWSVNGAPVAGAPAGGTGRWLPDGIGFVHLSVTDSDDRQAAADVRLQ